VRLCSPETFGLIFGGFGHSKGEVRLFSPERFGLIFGKVDNLSFAVAFNKLKI